MTWVDYAMIAIGLTAGLAIVGGLVYAVMEIDHYISTKPVIKVSEMLKRSEKK